MLQPIFDLAGSVFLTIPSGLSLDRIVELINDLEANLLGQNTKIKVVFDAYTSADITRCFEIIAQARELNITIEPYDSHFFSISRDEANSLVNSDMRFWEFGQEFITFQVLPNSDDYGVIKQLLIDSYGVYFQREPKAIIPRPDKIAFFENNLERLLADELINCFVVKSKVGEIVGTYCLSALSYDNNSKPWKEVQLTAVAGRYTGNNNFTKTKKLPLICTSLVREFANNPIFADFDTLTLSNSKKPVAQMYTDYGFERNVHRQGIIVSVG